MFNSLFSFFKKKKLTREELLLKELIKAKRHYHQTYLGDNEVNKVAFELWKVVTRATIENIRTKENLYKISSFMPRDLEGNLGKMFCSKLDSLG